MQGLELLVDSSSLARFVREAIAFNISIQPAGRIFCPEATETGSQGVPLLKAKTLFSWHIRTMQR